MELSMGDEVMIVIAVIGTAICVGIVFLLMRNKNQICEITRDELVKQLSETRDILSQSQVSQQSVEMAKTKAETQAERIPVLESQLQASQQELLKEKSHIAELDANLVSERKQADEKLALLNSARDQLKIEFENLAQKIFESRSKKFTEQNKESLSSILNPLKDQLDGFRQRVDDVYEKDSNGRTKLFHEIEQLKGLNQKISEDAINLTNALRGENKTQGNWGEMVLESLLEQSGLRKGYEYEVQGTFRNDDGKMLRPDVVLHLPEGKDIIIDSKVSLAAHDDYVKFEDSKDKEKAMKRLVVSIRAHIKELRSKNYDHIPSLHTLDYVFMFVPIEGVYAAALEADKTLYQDTMDQHIMVVTPSTLMLALKIIHNIWRYEKQNENALEIARRAGDLYDKFVNFTESLTEIGTRLDQAQDAYGTARKRLVDGKGNLVNKAEYLKELGAKAKKSLPAVLLNVAGEEDNLLDASH